MPKLPVTLIKGDKVGSETDYRDALPVNMYAIERDILGAKGYMLGYPGLTKIGDGSGIDRAGFYNDRFGDQYRVSGQKLISVSASGAVVELGDISGTEQCSLPYSFNTQAIIAGGRMWLYDPVNGLVETIDPDLGNPIDGVWVNGVYFLTDGEYLYHTKASAENEIDPLDFATAEFMPDKSLGISKNEEDKVLIWGRYTLEYVVDQGATVTTGFRFRRLENRAQKIGIVATHAKCEGGGNYYITGGRKEESVAVHKVSVGDAVKISTREIDKILGKYTEPALADMRMECRMENDIGFVIIHLPNETLCFNDTIAKKFGLGVAWMILKTDVKGTNPYRGINAVLDARSSRWIVGDRRDQTIGEIDNYVATHYGEIAEWNLYSPLIYLETFSIDEIEIETIPGFPTTQDATVAFSISYDGLTYGKETWELYGEPNKSGERFFIRRLGCVNDWLSFQLRGASRSRMAFALMEVTYS